LGKRRLLRKGIKDVHAFIFSGALENRRGACTALRLCEFLQNSKPEIYNSFKVEIWIREQCVISIINFVEHLSSKIAIVDFSPSHQFIQYFL
jgi:hypothetical protein